MDDVDIYSGRYCAHNKGNSPSSLLLLVRRAGREERYISMDTKVPANGISLYTSI